MKKLLKWLLIKLMIARAIGYPDGSVFITSLNYKNPLTYIALIVAILIYLVYCIIAAAESYCNVIIKTLNLKR